jgi:hypothetical protein
MLRVALSFTSQFAALCFATLGAIGHIQLAYADVITVETTGQAVATGAASDTQLERQALQHALYQAALKGGAKVNGYTAISQSVLTSDVLLVRPDAKILDYTVLDTVTNAKTSTVKIRAIVGELDAPALCERRADLTIALFPPTLKVDHQAPPWLMALKRPTTEALMNSLITQDKVSVRLESQDTTTTNSTLSSEYSYAALTQGVAAQAKTTPNSLKLRSHIKVHATKSTVMTDLLPVTLTVVLDSGLAGVPPLSAQSSLELPLHPRNAIATLAKRTSDPRQHIAGAIAESLSEMAKDLLTERACQLLAAPLEVQNGKLVLPFGRKDGLTKFHLAYTEGHDTAYEILEIVALTSHSSTLRPLDSARKNTELAGKRVKFMELKR